MAYISMVNYDDASQEVKRLFDDQINRHGRITNMKRTLLHSVSAFKALMEWYPLQEEVIKVIGERATNFYCYAISSENECMLCSTFFRKILVDLNIDFESFEFTEEEQLLIDYGRYLVKDPNHIPAEIFKKLKERYSEEQIVLLTAFGSMMIATNLINNSLQVPLDDVLVPYTKK